MTSAIDYFKAQQDEMSRWFDHMHRHPELSMQESATASFIAETLTGR